MDSYPSSAALVRRPLMNQKRQNWRNTASYLYLEEYRLLQPVSSTCTNLREQTVSFYLSYTIYCMSIVLTVSNAFSGKSTFWRRLRVTSLCAAFFIPSINFVLYTCLGVVECDWGKPCHLPIDVSGVRSIKSNCDYSRCEVCVAHDTDIYIRIPQPLCHKHIEKYRNTDK